MELTNVYHDCPKGRRKITVKVVGIFGKDTIGSNRNRYMKGLFDHYFWSNAISNAVGTLIAAIISAIFVYMIFNPIRRWLYQQNPRLAAVVQWVLSLITHPYIRLIVFVISIFILYIQGPMKGLWLTLSLIVFISFFSNYRKDYRLSSSSSIFSDNFQNSENKINTSKWNIKTGQPSLFFEMGRPRLRLTMASPVQATNSFLIAKDLEIDRGIVECDIYLSPNSVFNIVFFCDDKNDNWHMTRFEGRQTESDAFLIKDEGRGVNWRFNKILGTRTTEHQWHRVHVEFSSEKARMFKDGDFLGEITNPQILGKKVGIFNECGEVLIGDFTISKQ